MARPLRIQYEGACYHVMNRGNGRRAFHGDDDSGLFLEKLARPVRTVRVSLRASRLMPNHSRLYIATPETSLSRFTPCAIRGWNGPSAPGERAMMLVSGCDPEVPQPGDPQRVPCWTARECKHAEAALMMLPHARHHRRQHEHTDSWNELLRGVRLGTAHSVQGCSRSVSFRAGGFAL